MMTNQRIPMIRPVQMTKPNGVVEVFSSLQRAAEAARVSPERMDKAIRESQLLNGCRWRYVKYAR